MHADSGHLKSAKAIEPYRIHFFEDPFLDIPEVARYVTEKCPVPVANGERCFNLYELSNLVQNTDVAFLRPDMCTIGGITAGMKVAHFAEAHNINIIPHNPLARSPRSPRSISTALCRTSRCRSGRARSATSTR